MKAKKDFSGFYRLDWRERLSIVKEFANLSDEEAEILTKAGSLGIETANRMIENVIGTQEMPFGIATNFIINGSEHLIPMSIEEPSVVAAASNAAKLCRPKGFLASGGEPIMTGQIQIMGIKHMESAMDAVMKNHDELIKVANEKDPGLVSHGGGVIRIETEELHTIRGPMMIASMDVDVRDAMGANAINTMCEAVSPYLEEITGGKTRLRIVTNLATKRVCTASAVWKKDIIGEESVEGILDAYAFALDDIYRCTTHNKGVMNGIDAVALATSQDFRALEAGAHSYASMSGKYMPLTQYEKGDNGNLVGRIKIPLPVGIVGGASKTNPVARIALKILGVKTSQEFGQVLACVGLAQNFAALKALSTVGIQSGHMKLHAKNIAVMAGATGDMIDKVADHMISENNINVTRAKEIMEKMQK